MTIRKRHQPTPGFRLPPPYKPTTGERAKLLVPGISPYCAMMQIAAEDTHCDYVICRGYDPRNRKYYDYDSDDEDKPGIAVAKPFWSREKGIYRIGEVYPAILPLSSGAEQGGIIVPFIGQNPGKAEPDGAECKGHPDTLEEEIVLLADDEGIYINWMLLDGGKKRVRFCTKDNHPGMGIVFEAYAPGVWNPDSHEWDFTCDADHTHKIVDQDYGVPEPDAGAQGYADWEVSTVHGKILVVVTMDCESRHLCCA